MDKYITNKVYITNNERISNEPTDAFKLSIKKTKNRSHIIKTVFTNLHIEIAKILEPKVRLGRGEIENLIYRNVLNIRNNGHILV